MGQKQVIAVVGATGMQGAGWCGRFWPIQAAA